MTLHVVGLLLCRRDHLSHGRVGHITSGRAVGGRIGSSIPVVLRPLVRDGVTLLGRGRILRVLHHLDG